MTGIPLFTDAIETNRALGRLGTDAVPASTEEVLDATEEETLLRNPGASALRWLRRREAFLPEGARVLSAEEATRDYGLDGALAFDRPVAELHARELRDLKQAEIRRADVMARAQGGLLEGAAQLGTGLLLSAVDPINLASAFVPLVGPARYGTWVARAGSAGGRAAVRAGVGAAEGAVGAALVEPIVYGVARSEQADYDAVDSLLNVAFGAGLGGGLHALGGGVMDLAAARFRAPVEDLAEAATPEGREAAARAALARVAEDLPVEGAQEALELGQPAGRPRRDWRARGAASLRGPQAVFDADGRRVMVRYEVVDARDLVTSHTDELVENPAFPAEMQPRDRTRAAAEQQINDIVANFAPERLGIGPDAATGAPIADAVGVVESGNGRVLSLRRVLAADGEDARRYRAFVAGLGFDVSGVERPVLIRRRVSDLSAQERRAFTVAAQKSGTLDLSTTERALADAKRLDGILPLLEGADVGQARNARFVRAFVDRLPQADQGQMLTAGGELSLDGKRRVEAALLARAFDDAELLGRMLETADDNSKAIAGALLDVAPDWARMRAAAAAGEISGRVDATADLLAAVRAVRDARASGRPLAEVLSQRDMFGGRSPAADLFLGAILRVDGEGRARTASREAIGEDLRRFVGEALKSSPDADMFGAAPPDAAEVLRALGKRAPELRADPDGEAAVRAAEAAAERARAEPVEDTLDVEEAAMDAEIERARGMGLLRDEPELAEAERIEARARAEGGALEQAAFCLSRSAA